MQVHHEVFQTRTHCVVHSKFSTLLNSTITRKSHRALFMMVDNSGSMSADLESVQQAQKLCVQDLPVASSAALYSFSSNVQCLVPIGPTNKDTLMTAIDHQYARGATNTHASLRRLSYDVDVYWSKLSVYQKANTQIEIHYFTDGMPTCGPGTHNMIISDEQVVCEALSMPIGCTPFVAMYAFGGEVNIQLLGRLSSTLSGTVYAVPSLEDLGKVWGSVMAGMETTLTPVHVVLEVPNAVLLVGSRHHRYLSSGQAVYTLWKVETPVRLVSCVDAEEQAKVVINHFDEKKQDDDDNMVSQWINYHRFTECISQADSMLAESLEKQTLWAKSLEPFRKSVPGILHAEVARRIDQIHHLCVGGGGLTRLVSDNTSYCPPTLCRSNSSFQTDSGSAYAIRLLGPRGSDHQ
jgi:hypothetical protein